MLYRFSARPRALSITAVLIVAAAALCADIVVSAQQPCREQEGDTSPDYRCEKADKDCPQKNKEVSVSFGVSGGVVVVDVSGSVSYPFSVPDGCDAAQQPWVDEQYCTRSTGVQFTGYPGSVKELRKQNCPSFTSKACRERAYEITITPPQSILDWLEDQLGVAPPANFSFPLPAKACEVDPNAQVQSFVCPGSGQTWYDIVDDTCYP